MPTPTAAAVAGYGGSGGAIAAAAGASAEEGGAPSEVTEAVTETALTRLETSLIGPRLVGAPYPPPTTEPPSGVEEPVGASMFPEHSDGLGDGELPAGTVTVVETDAAATSEAHGTFLGKNCLRRNRRAAGRARRYERCGLRWLDDAPHV